jgi:hypothetical protein
MSIELAQFFLVRSIVNFVIFTLSGACGIFLGSMVAPTYAFHINWLPEVLLGILFFSILIGYKEAKLDMQKKGVDTPK